MSEKITELPANYKPSEDEEYMNVLASNWAGYLLLPLGQKACCSQKVLKSIRGEPSYLILKLCDVVRPACLTLRV